MKTAYPAYLKKGFQPMGAQFAHLERLEDVAKRLRDPGVLQGLFVAVRGEIDHGDIQLSADLAGGLDAVHLARELDVHQHQVGPNLGRQADGLFAGCHGRRHSVAEISQRALKIERDNHFVFDDEDLDL